MPNRKIVDFYGTAIDLNNVKYLEIVGNTYDGYGIKFVFWSGAHKTVNYGHYNYDRMKSDYNYAIRNM
jgi:hypothetical protein